MDEFAKGAILFQQHPMETAFYQEPTELNIRCDYSTHEYSMDVHIGSDLPQCVEMSKPGAPAHFNSASISATYNLTSISILVLDFYNQDPHDSPADG